MDIATKLSDLRADLSECRRAITYRGGEISATAGFKEVAEKIASLPASSSIGTVVDESSSLLKIVPVDSTKYCYLKSLGGMTYKSNNLIPFPYIVNDSVVSAGVTFTVNTDGSISANGTPTGAFNYNYTKFALPAGTYTYSAKGISKLTSVVSLRTKEGNTFVKNIGDIRGSKTYLTFTISAEEAASANVWINIYNATGVLDSETIYPMLNTGSTALPYEPYYEGLRDNKATAIKNYGANYLKPYYSAGYTQTKGGITYTVIDDDGTFIINGTANGTPAFVIANYLDLPIDDYYLAGNCVSGTWVSGVEVYTSRYHASTYNVASIKIPSAALPTWISVQIKSGTVVNNLTFKPMLSRKQVIPYTPYHEPITYPIPYELQGTGKGVEGAADTIDFENGKKTTRVKTIALGDVTGYMAENRGSASSHPYISDAGLISVISYSFKDFSIPLRTKALCNRLPNMTDWQGNTIGVNLQNMASGSHFIQVCIKASDAGATTDDAYATIVAKVVQWLKENNVTLTYAVAEPTTEDIDTSAFDNLIEVEGGGSLEIITDNGMAVPTTFIYQTIV